MWQTPLKMMDGGGHLESPLGSRSTSPVSATPGENFHLPIGTQRIQPPGNCKQKKPQLPQFLQKNAPPSTGSPLVITRSASRLTAPAGAAATRLPHGST